MTDRQARGMHTVDDAHEAARDSYMYAKAFFEEHGRHLSAAPSAMAGSRPAMHVAGAK
jgi:hypothetical protein